MTKNDVYVVLMSIILEALISFEEQQNGLYDMLLSVTAV